MSHGRVGLVAAMPLESAALRSLVGGARRIAFHGYRAWDFGVGGLECRLVECGMGFVRSEEATRVLCRAFAPAVIVSYGIAGAPHAGLSVGDVVMASSVCLLEGGSCRECTTLSPPTEEAFSAARTALSRKGGRLHAGTAVSTHGSQTITADVHNPVLEMETIGVSRAAGEQGVPVVSIRGISDTREDPSPIPIDRLVDADFNVRAALILWTCVQHPMVLPRLLRFLKNGRIAAEHAAYALMAVVSSMARGDAA